MKIAIGSDHGGYRLKEDLKQFMSEQGIAFKDYGTYSPESVDYPDIAEKVAQALKDRDCDKGVLICGTGIGISIAANKIPGIRAALCHDTFSAKATREHNDSNILAMGERVIGFGLAREVLETWLGAEFAGGRHAARVNKIISIEEKYGRSSC